MRIKSRISLLLLALLLVLAFQAVHSYRAGAAVAKPIPAGPKAFTHRDFQKIRSTYFHRLIPEAYQTAGIKDPSWDGPALALLNKYADCLAGVSEPKELAPLTQPLLASQCKDPLVLYAIGRTLILDNKLREAEPYLQQAVEGFKQSNYSKAVSWSAPLRLADIYQQLGEENAKEADSLVELSIKWIGEGAAEKVSDRREVRVLWNLLSSYFSDQLSDKLEEVYQSINQQPDADPWLLHMVGGNNEIDKAWAARGSGWAYTVTEAGWKGFYEHLQKAREHLVKAWQLRPDYPEAPARMITVVMGESGKQGETERLWFDRAVAAQMDYEPAYEQLLNALLPRWSGSHEEMYQFGLACLATKRFDTEVPMWFYRAIWKIAEYDDEPSFWQRPGVYSHLCTLCQGMLDEPSRPKKEELKSLWAALAWRCGKYADAKRLLDELHGKVVASDFKVRFKTDPQWAISEVYALTGPSRVQMEQADKLRKAGKSSKARALYEGILAKNKDPRTERYLRDQLASLRVEAGLQTGQWVPLSMSKDLLGWQEWSGKWSVAGDGSLTLKPGECYPVLLSNSRVGENYELAVQIEFQGGDPAISAGIVMNFKKVDCWDTDSILLRRDGMLLLRPSEGKETVKHLMGGDKYDLLVRVEGLKVTISLDGQKELSGLLAKDTNKPAAPGYLGLTAYFPDAIAGNGVVKFRNLKIRRVGGSR